MKWSITYLTDHIHYASSFYHPSGGSHGSLADRTASDDTISPPSPATSRPPAVIGGNELLALLGYSVKAAAQLAEALVTQLAFRYPPSTTSMSRTENLPLLGDIMSHSPAIICVLDPGGYVR